MGTSLINSFQLPIPRLSTCLGEEARTGYLPRLFAQAKVEGYLAIVCTGGGVHHSLSINYDQRNQREPTEITFSPMPGFRRLAPCDRMRWAEDAAASSFGNGCS